MQVLIIGGGISGLICARYLEENSEYQITIIEEKAEIGHPQTRPSHLIDHTLVSDHNTPIQLGKSGCRRPWLAKSLAQQLSSKGISINVRTRIISTNPLQMSGAGPPTNNSFDIIVNTTKNKFNSNTQIISEIKNNELTYTGGISINREIPGQPIVTSLLSNNLTECWYEGNIPEIEGGWLERMEGTFPIQDITIDASFARGERLAQSVLELTNQSSQQIA